ncbi:Hypotetical protein [Gulosibacter molinativorax]|nr:Hypotetical protein [Gulosibacter molinativorax]
MPLSGKSCRKRRLILLVRRCGPRSEGSETMFRRDPKSCRWFHSWADTDKFYDIFSIVDQCRKCGLYRITNLFTEQTTFRR